MRIRHIFIFKNVEDVPGSLEVASVSLSIWLKNNILKGNVDKCHFLVSTSQKVSLIVNNFKIKIIGCEKPLGIKFDSNLTDYRFVQKS